MTGKLKIYRSPEPIEEERTLIVAASKGDQEAFHGLYEMHRERVYRLLYHMSPDSSLAEDLLHEVFLKVYKALPRFRFESTFSTWIYRIALNEIRYQKRQAKGSIPLERIIGSRLERDGSPDPMGIHVARERRTWIRRALLGLAPKLRSVIVLKYVDGLSYEEMAEILDCSPGTVASRLSRALQKLQRLLQPFDKHL